MQEWRSVLPEAGLLVSAGLALWRLAGRGRWRSVITIKNRLFDIAGQQIRIEACEGENRALREALARRVAMDELKNPDSFDASSYGPFGTHDTPSRTSPTTRSLSRRLVRRKPSGSKSDTSETSSKAPSRETGKGGDG